MTLRIGWVSIFSVYLLSISQTLRILILGKIKRDRKIIKFSGYCVDQKTKGYYGLAPLHGDTAVSLNFDWCQGEHIQDGQQSDDAQSCDPRYRFQADLMGEGESNGDGKGPTRRSHQNPD